jgi:DTW domain-containing protein YfiP
VVGIAGPSDELEVIREAIAGAAKVVIVDGHFTLRRWRLNTYLTWVPALNVIPKQVARARISGYQKKWHTAQFGLAGHNGFSAGQNH